LLLLLPAQLRLLYPPVLLHPPVLLLQALLLTITNTLSGTSPYLSWYSLPAPALNPAENHGEHSNDLDGSVCAACCLQPQLVERILLCVNAAEVCTSLHVILSKLTVVVPLMAVLLQWLLPAKLWSTHHSHST
jgi:hypothetical protein